MIDPNNQTPVLWQRPKGIYNDIPFHLPREDLKCGQDWHYFQTLCGTEVKTCYNNWEITDNPDPKQCCKKCLELLNKKTPK